MVYGYVLFEGDDETITKTEEEVTKSQGFVAGSTEGVYATNDVDYYETFNLKVKKSIAGGLAETGHAFPFSVAFSAAVTTDAVIEWGLDGTTSTTEATIKNQALTLGDATVDKYGESGIKLANDKYVTFYGIPAATKAVVSEINDSYDVYTASKTVEGGTTAEVADINLAANHVAASIFAISDVENTTTVTAGSEKDTELTVTNTIAIISPTGYVARIAPYALMLAAGVALLVIFLKRRKPVAEDDE